MSDTDYHTQTQAAGQQKQEGHKSNYGRFLAMVGTSTAIMFGLMYLNSYSIEHLYWSETRFYMTFVMGATMAVVMLLFMWGMYRNRTMNTAILAGSVLLFAGALWLVRSQVTVQDESWMRAMIPHHSIAIMTSERAHIRDPRVRELADQIIEAQVSEIAEMERLIAELEQNPPPPDARDLEPLDPAEVLTR